MASGSIDPYHEWLGIPATEQPPHLYRLLGLALFEDDPNVIQHAADRQMAHVRQFQRKQPVEAGEVLNQLASARLTLLSPQKASYDQQLRASLATSPERVEIEGRVWYYQLNGGVIGPNSADEMHERVKGGCIRRGTLVRKGPAGQWCAAECVKGLFDLPIAAPPPPIPAPAHTVSPPPACTKAVNSSTEVLGTIQPTLSTAMRQKSGRSATRLIALSIALIAFLCMMFVSWIVLSLSRNSQTRPSVTENLPSHSGPSKTISSSPELEIYADSRNEEENDYPEEMTPEETIVGPTIRTARAESIEDLIPGELPETLVYDGPPDGPQSTMAFDEIAPHGTPRASTPTKQEDWGREWTDSTGTFKVLAKLVTLGEENEVLLEKRDGETITIPMFKLSSPDQRYVKRIVGDQKLREILRAADEAMEDVARENTTTRRQEVWNERVTDLCKRFRNERMTFNFRIRDVQKAGNRYLLFVDILSPDTTDRVPSSRVRLRAIDRFPVDISKDEALKIGENSELVVNGIATPDLAYVTSAVNGADKWVAYLDLPDAEEHLFLFLSRATWRIEPLPEPHRPDEKKASRTQWYCATYGGTIFHRAENRWQEVGKNSEMNDLIETARTDEYIELSGFNFGKGRIYPNRLEMFKDGEWQWVANGSWQ